MGALDFSDKAIQVDGSLDFSDASLEAHNRAPSIMDVAKAALVGYIPDTAKALGWGLEKMGVDYGTEMRKGGAETERNIVESMTPGGQRAYQTPIFEGDGLTDLHLSDAPGGALAMGALRSIPQMAMTAPIGGPVAAGVSKVIPAAARAAPGIKGLLARNAPGALGFGGAEGLQAATQNAEQTQSEIEGTSHADLQKSPRYLELLETMGREEARQTLAHEAAADVFKRTLPWTGGVGIATGGGALGELVKPGVKSVVKGIAKGAGEEALQEAPQSAGEELIQNLAKRDYVDPTQDPWKGVAAAGASGAAIGGVTGGALGGGAHAFSGRTVDGQVTGREETSSTVSSDPLAAARGAAQDTESAAAVVRRTVDSIKQRVAAMGAQPKETTSGNEPSGNAAADETGARAPAGEGAETVRTASAVPAEAVDTIDGRAHEAAPSPQNERPDPTDAQVRAGNYKKGHADVWGMDISFENPAGSTRSDTKNQPPKWSVEMKDHYGYIKRTTGFDKDHLDAFVKPGTGYSFNGPVYIVNQGNDQGKFDEHKTMIGYGSQDEAKAAYLANYDDPQKASKRIRSIVSLPMEKFKEWAYNATRGPSSGELVLPATHYLDAKHVIHLVTPEAGVPKGASSFTTFEAASDARLARLKGVAKDKKTVDVDRDSIITAVQKLGGINMGHRLDIIGDDKGNASVFGTGHLFTKAGHGPDDMATRLGQYGYLTAEELDDVDGGVQALKDKIRDEFDGHKKHFSLSGTALEREAEENYLAEEEYDSEAAALADQVERPDDWSKLTEDEQNARLDDLFGADTRERTAPSGEEAGARDREETLEQHPGEREPGQDDEEVDGERPKASRGDRRAVAERTDSLFDAPAETKPALELKGQTEAEIKADADARRRAEEEKKKKEAAPAPEEFTLSGSDRKADVAAAHGQKDIFSAPAKEASKPLESAEPSRNLNVRHTCALADVTTPAGALKADARNSDADSAPWYYQGDLGQLQFVANVKFEGKADDRAPEAKKTLAMLKAARDAGWSRVNMRAGSYGTVWTLQKDKEILTNAGAEALRTGAFKATAVEETGDHNRDTYLKSRAVAADFSVWMATLPASTLENISALQAKIGSTPMGDRVGLYRESGGQPRIKFKELGGFNLGTPMENAGSGSMRPRTDYQSLLVTIVNYSKLPEDIEHWVDASRQAEAAAVEQVTEGGTVVDALHKQGYLSEEAPADEKPKTGVETIEEHGKYRLRHNHDNGHWGVLFDLDGATNGRWFGGEDGETKARAMLKTWMERDAENKKVHAEIKETQKSNPEQKTSLAAHREFMGSLYDGEVSIEEYKAQFERVVAQKDRLIEQLQVMKKDDLLKELGGFSASRYRGEKKERIVQAAYDDMQMGFTLSRGLSFSMGKGAQEAALRKMVDGTTAADLKEFADRVSAQRKERKDRIDGIKKALKNPETMAEFEDFIKYHKAGEPGLTPEQRAKYDELVAEKTKGKRAEDQEKKATVQAAGELVGATITETKHTQKGHDLFVVKLERRVERDVYEQLSTAAKKLGGYYSSYTKGGAVAGFQFKAKADAEAFQKLAVEGDAAAATEAAIERKGDRREEKKNAAAERLAEMADKLEASANESLNRDRLSNTNKRAQQAASAEAGARSDIAFAKTLRNLSEAIESGEAKHLDGIRTKAQVATLTKLAESARYATVRKQYPSYVDFEKHGDRPLEVADIDVAEYPALTGRKEDFRSAANRFDSKPGSKRLAERFRKMAQAIHDDEWHAMGRQIVEEAVEKAGTDTYAVPWHWAENLAKIKRLEAAGIPNVNVLRAALREFIQFKGEKPKADKVKELERALVGQNVGFDFFPTPAPLAARMAEMLDVKPGMRVLEPSAGKGNLADAVRDEYPGAEVDVVEQSNTLREILKEKGYSILGHDFNDFEKSIKYDRIIMNPPFSDGIDADHVRKAYAHLAPGGRLVAITGEGIFFRKDKKAQEFRTWFDSVNGTSEQMEGAFLDRHEVATTGVNSRLLVIDKPEERAAMASRRAVTTMPAFKRWFAGSKVVDADGKPLVVYHGTDRDITEFSTKGAEYKNGYSTNGAAWFTTNPVQAEWSATELPVMRGAERSEIAPAIYPVYLAVQNPLRVDKQSDWFELGAAYPTKKDIAKIKAAGHDGVFFPDPQNPGRPLEIMVFDSSQIKSATGNAGGFDEHSGNIMASRQSENIEDYKPQTKTGKSGQPLFWNDHIALAKPEFQYNLADGERTVGYGIYDVKNLDADGKPTKVGSLLMDLGEDDKVVGLQNIEIRQALRQSGKGLGETVIATLLAHNGALPIRIHNIQHHRDDGWDALPFWKKMGTRIDNFSTDPEVEINGWLSRTDYLKARGVGGKLSRGLNRETDLPSESAGADRGRGGRGEADRGRARSEDSLRGPAVGAGPAKNRLRADAGGEGAGERGRAGAAGRNAAGLTPEQVRARLIEAFGPKIDTLLQDKVLNIVETPADLPPKLAAAAQSLDEAWYDPKANDGEGAIYFIASGLRPERVVPVLLHELGEHYNLPKMLGADGYAALHREVRALHARGTSSAVEDAWRHVRENYPDLKEADVDFASEVIAKVGESAAGRNLPFFKRLMAAVRTWLLKLGLKANLVSNLTDEDLRTLVEASARQAIRKAGNAMAFRDSPMLARAIDKPKKEAALAAYAAGKTADEVSDEFKIGATTILRWADSAGIARSAAETKGVTDEKKEEVIRLYDTGLSVAKVSDQTGVGTSTVHRIVTAAGSARSLAAVRDAPADVKARALELYGEGKNTYEVAEETGVSQSGVARWAVEAGISRGYSGAQALRVALGRNNAGYGIKAAFSSEKSGDSIKAMSLYELARLGQLEADSNVTSFSKATDRIPYGDGRHYVPDIEVKMADGSTVVEEIKPEYKLDDPVVQEKAAAAMKFYEAKGVKYQIVTERTIGLAGFDTVDVDATNIGDADRKRASASLAAVRAALRQSMEDERLIDESEQNDSEPKASRAASPQTDLFGSPAENKRKVDLFTPRGQDNLADRAKSYLASFLDSDRTFNWWHRSVGTQYHKATVSAPFRRVFNEGQAFLTDTNRFSMQAEEKAPEVLLRVEGIKDLTKRPPSPAEIETLGRTLFEGTLFGGADPTKGKVFTDEELKAKGLNAKQVGLYRQVRASIDDSIDTVAKSTIARLLRTYEMKIDRDMSLADVTADALEQLEEHRGELNLAIEAQTDDPAERHRVSQKIDVVHTAIEKVDKIHKRAVALQKGGYMPLMRFGRYSVNVFESGATGKKVEKFFGMYESQAEANRAARALQSKFPDATIDKGIMSKEAYRIFQGISPDTIELFSEIAGLDEHPLMQQFIQLTVSERSALKRLLERKGIPGFDWDVPKVLANFITSNARAASGNYHHAEMLHAVDDIPKGQGDVKDEAVRLYEYLTKPKEEAAALRGYMFFHFMGGSIATAMVNMTQPVMMTAPRLAVDHSAAKVAKELGRAMLEAARQNPPTDTAGKAMKKAEDEGIVAPHEIYQLMAEAKGGIGRNIALRQFTRVWGGLFSLAEAWNRKATFLAAYRLAEGTRGADPYAYAVRVVNETQGLYNRGNRPNWARGTIGATVMTFKQYSIAYLELLKRLPAPQRALALGILVLAAGLQGLPGADDLDDILDTLGQWMGYATNSKQWKRKAIEAMLGKDIGQFVLHGASAIPATPLDVQMRLGLGNLIPGTSMLKPSDGADKGQEIAEVFGPAGGLAKSAFDVTREVFQGDIAGMAKAGLPASLRNAYQALEMFQTGEYRDSKGRRVVDASAQDAFVKAVGFNPTVVARESRKVGEAVTNINLQKETETSIAEQWVRGIVDHKDDEVDAARERMAEWNRTNPELPVAINKQQIRQRVLQARRSREERFIKSAPKEIRGRVAEELRD